MIDQDSANSNTDVLKPLSRDRSNDTALNAADLLIDWVNCTFDITDRAERIELEHWLGGVWYDFKSKWKYGQNWRKNREDMRMFTTRRDRTHLRITGSGCLALQQRDDFPGWVQFLEQLSGRGAKFYRLDLTMDDTSNLLDMDILMESARMKHYQAKAAKGYLRLENGEASARIIRIGSRKSESYTRIYDKRLAEASRASRGSVDLPDHWIRVELELKKGSAQRAAQHIMEGGLERIPGIIRNYLNFIDRSSATRIARCKTADWWDKFLGGAEKIPLRLPRRNRKAKEIEQRGDVAPLNRDRTRDQRTYSP